MSGMRDFNDEILSLINERQQITYNELSDIMLNKGILKEELDIALSYLEGVRLIASRKRGGIPTYYKLQDDNPIKKVLIVEDDKSINKLMAISLGEGYDISQLYDGGEAIGFIRKNRPNLVILDLMLPNKDGLDICQTIKGDSNIDDTVVIIVSAMDPTSNRFRGIKYGADYYIKKPFDPAELRSLVTLFLKKKGRKFDPLIDLPDEARISAEIEHSLKEGERYIIGTLKIENFSAYAIRFGSKSATVILRLISQLLQDTIKSRSPKVFAGFLNSNGFVIAGPKDDVESVVDELKKEFVAVLPFILQDEGYKPLELNIESLFESKEVPKLSLVFTETEKEELIQRRREILEDKGKDSNEVGAYTYEELQRLFGNQNFDITITRTASGIKLKVGKITGGEYEPKET